LPLPLPLPLPLAGPPVTTLEGELRVALRYTRGTRGDHRPWSSASANNLDA